MDWSMSLFSNNVELRGSTMGSRKNSEKCRICEGEEDQANRFEGCERLDNIKEIDTLFDDIKKGSQLATSH